MQQKQAEFLNRMIDMGVAGFRVDAAKHMWPRDLTTIQGMLHDTVFGGKPFFAHEVIDLGDGAIRVCGVMWCDVVWGRVVWGGVVCGGVVWCGVVWCGVAWCMTPSSAASPSSPMKSLTWETVPSGCVVWGGVVWGGVVL